MRSYVSPAEKMAHVRAMATVREAGIPALVGGAYAMFHYTGLHRHTKDLDLFLRRGHEADARHVLLAAGYRTELVDPVWLSKALWGDIFVDLIFSSGNGIAEVDDEWFEHGVPGNVLGMDVRLVPPEEMIWSKAFVQERERWDGADVAHLLRACGRGMDWQRLMRRFEDHWQVLLAHLSLFSYAYPSDRDIVPSWVWDELLDSAADQTPEHPVGGKVCRGTLLSRKQYDLDVGLWGYRDARELPNHRDPTRGNGRDARAGDDLRAAQEV